MQPVTDVAAVTIDRQRLFGDDVGYKQRDQLLRKMIGAVVIGAAGD